MFRTSSRAVAALCWRRSCAAALRADMSSSASAVKDGKVIVNFKHTGDAPILRTAKFKVPADAPFHTVTALLRKALGLQAQDPLVCARPPHACPLPRSAQPRPNCRQFLYCNSAFAPPPDELVSDVAECFHVEGVLVLNYCLTPAWG